MAKSPSEHNEDRPLTLKQRLFVAAYLGDHDCKGNATRAALKAGYSPKTAAFIGCENLKKPNIQQAIAEFVTKVDEVAIGNVNKRLEVLDDLKNRYLTVIAERADAFAGDEEPGAATGLMLRIVRFTGSGENQTKTVEYKIDDVVREAIQNLDAQAAKELNQWSERVDLTGSMTSVVEIVGVDAGDI